MPESDKELREIIVTLLVVNRRETKIEDILVDAEKICKFIEHPTDK